MARYRLLPNALEHIDAVMRALSIQPVQAKNTPAQAAKDRARYYMTPVRWRGQVVWFKARLQDAPGLDRSLAEEITVQRAFASYERGRRMSFSSPSFLASGHHGPVYWLLRRYWTGWFAGDMTTTFGFSPRFIRTISAKRFAAVLGDVRAMTTVMRHRLSLPTHDSGWYLLDFHFYRRHFLRPLLKHSLNPGWSTATIAAMERVIRDSAPWLRRQAHTFTHGDFYPNNLMITGQHRQQVVLFDWELAHLNLATFDAVMAWLMAWRYPAWQKQFYQDLRRGWPKNQDMDRAWAMASLSLGLRLAGFAFLRLTNGQPDRYPPLSAKYRPIMKKMFQRMAASTEEALATLVAL